MHDVGQQFRRALNATFGESLPQSVGELRGFINTRSAHDRNKKESLTGGAIDVLRVALADDSFDAGKALSRARYSAPQGTSTPITQNAEQAAHLDMGSGVHAQTALREVFDAKLVSAPKMGTFLSTFNAPVEFPNLFVANTHSSGRTANIPASEIQASRDALGNALQSVFRRLSIPIAADGMTARPVPYFEFLRDHLRDIDPDVQIIPSGGVVRAALAYLYSAMVDSGQCGPAALNAIAASSTPIAASKIRGVGSDLDVFLRSPAGKMSELVQRGLRLTNSAEQAYGFRDSKAGFKRAFFAVGDIKDFDKHMARSVAQGGSTIDFLGFDEDTGAFLEPEAFPHIVDDFLRGQFSYVTPATNAESPCKQTIRGMRPALELPWLNLKDDAVLRSELKALLTDAETGRFPRNPSENKDKVLEQFAKMARNARFRGAHNRIYRAAPGSIDALFASVVTCLSKSEGRPLLPEFLGGAPIVERTANPDLADAPLMPVHDFVRKHTDNGCLYHGTPAIELGMAIMRQGLFIGNAQQGRKMCGRGTYTSPAASTAQAFAGSGGLVVKLTVLQDLPLNILDWATTENTNFGRMVQTRAMREGREVFELLANTYSIDVIISHGHVLLQNANAIEIPEGLNALLDGLVNALKCEGVPLERRVALHAEYRRLHSFTHDAGGNPPAPPYDREVFQALLKRDDFGARVPAWETFATFLALVDIDDTKQAHSLTAQVLKTALRREVLSPAPGRAEFIAQVIDRDCTNARDVATYIESMAASSMPLTPSNALYQRLIDLSEKFNITEGPAALATNLGSYIESRGYGADEPKQCGGNLAEIKSLLDKPAGDKAISAIILSARLHPSALHSSQRFLADALREHALVLAPNERKHLALQLIDADMPLTHEFGLLLVSCCADRTDLRNFVGAMAVRNHCVHPSAPGYALICEQAKKLGAKEELDCMMPRLLQWAAEKEYCVQNSGHASVQVIDAVVTWLGPERAASYVHEALSDAEQLQRRSKLVGRQEFIDVVIGRYGGQLPATAQLKLVLDQIQDGAKLNDVFSKLIVTVATHPTVFRSIMEKIAQRGEPLYPGSKSYTTIRAHATKLGAAKALECLAPLFLQWASTQHYCTNNSGSASVRSLDEVVELLGPERAAPHIRHAVKKAVLLQKQGYRSGRGDFIETTLLHHADAMPFSEIHDLTGTLARSGADFSPGVARALVACTRSPSEFGTFMTLFAGRKGPLYPNSTGFPTIVAHARAIGATAELENLVPKFLQWAEEKAYFTRNSGAQCLHIAEQIVQLLGPERAATALRPALVAAQELQRKKRMTGRQEFIDGLLALGLPLS